MLSIITPTYNEAKNIEQLVKRIHSTLKNIDYEIIVADDNSPDGTAKVAKDLPKKYKTRTIVRTKNKGLAPAVMDGFKAAKGDILAVIDADLSHPPELLKEMFKRVKDDYDIVVASRLIKGGGTENWPNSRKLTSYAATLLARPITKIKDPMSGYFMLKRKVIQHKRIKTKGYKILLEILARGNYKKTIEIPYTFKDRTAGESKLGLKVNIQYVNQLLRIYIDKVCKK